MARQSPVMKATPTVVVIARTAHRGRRCNHFIRECGQDRDNLEHRTKRILSLRRTVVQRKMRIGAQRPPRSERGTKNKRVRIKGRLARQSENLAITQVEDHDGATVTFEKTLSKLL